MQEWNSRDTLPKDGTKIRLLWSNGKEDVGYFNRLDYGPPWVEEVMKVEQPEIYDEGGEWVTDYGEGDNSEFHPVGWLPLTANTCVKPHRCQMPPAYAPPAQVDYPPINKEGLLAALAQIEAHPETWDQMSWHCDTAHCVGGWGQILAGKKPDDDTVRRDARQFYGLTNYEADRLFAAHNTLDRIREIIEQLTAEGYGDSYDITGFDRDGYDCDGFDRHDYNRDGFNRAGFDRDGYDRHGYDCDGFDRSGYDRDGYDFDGLDRMNRTREESQ